jgi:uncharacterized protein (TIGR03435 family)
MTLLRALVLTLACGHCAAAQPQEKPQFDVASVKPASTAGRGRLPFVVPQMQGGPGTSEPGHLVLHVYTLIDLIDLAYSVKFSQVSAPDWLLKPDRVTSGTMFEIEAKFPADTTKEQMNLMFQSLLEDRFAMKVHRETKPGTVYWLTVGKNGPKLKESPPVTPPSEPPEHEALGPRGDDGFPTMSPSHSGILVHVENGVIHDKFMRRSMPQFAEWLWGMVKQPVVDRTGLTGIYDFYLTHGTPRNSNATQAIEPAGTDIFGAMQQLGLKLSPEKGDLEILVIDNVNRTPSAN